MKENKIFIYFWLCWAFIASFLCGFFSGLGRGGWRGVLLSSFCAWTSHCGGFFCWEAWAVGKWISVAVHGLSCSMVCGIFPDRELNLCHCTGRWILNHCITKEVIPLPCFLPNSLLKTKTKIKQQQQQQQQQNTTKGNLFSKCSGVGDLRSVFVLKAS